MNLRDIISPARLGVVFVVALLANGAAVAVDIPADSLKLAPGVAKAAAYETPATTYIVANSTNVYSGPSLVDTKVTGKLNRGDHVDVLAKVKGWEWASRMHIRYREGTTPEEAEVGGGTERTGR